LVPAHSAIRPAMIGSDPWRCKGTNRPTLFVVEVRHNSCRIVQPWGPLNPTRVLEMFALQLQRETHGVAIVVVRDIVPPNEPAGGHCFVLGFPRGAKRINNPPCAVARGSPLSTTGVISRDHVLSRIDLIVCALVDSESNNHSISAGGCAGFRFEVEIVSVMLIYWRGGGLPFFFLSASAIIPSFGGGKMVAGICDPLWRAEPAAFSQSAWRSDAPFAHGFLAADCSICPRPLLGLAES